MRNKRNNMKKTILCQFIILLLLINCSSTGSVFIKDKYADNKDAMVKKVIVAVTSPEKYREITPLVSNIAADIIKLRTNYLVYEYKTVEALNWNTLCSKKVDGIFLFTLEKSEIQNDKVNLKIKSELYKCSDNELIWKITGSKNEVSGNSDLKELTSEYGKKYSKTAPLYSAPSFVIIQDIIESVPDPELTDAEIDIKIKLDAVK